MGADQERAARNGKRGRDPEYVQRQKAEHKRQREEAAAEEADRKEKEQMANKQPMNEKTELSAEVEGAIDKFFEDEGIVTLTESEDDEELAEEEVNDALEEQKAGGVVAKAPKAEKAPKEPKEPKATKTPAHLLEGNCRCCGKTLTVAKSVHRGVGPTCFAQLHVALDLSESQAKERMEHASDTEWAALIDQLREALRTNPESVDAPPEGYVTLASVSKLCKEHNIPVSRWIKAFGGDRNINEPERPEFAPIYVGRTRYVHPDSFALLRELAAQDKPKALVGAAKTAKEQAEAKKDLKHVQKTVKENEAA